jgi:hypothetical protein
VGAAVESEDAVGCAACAVGGAPTGGAVGAAGDGEPHATTSASAAGHANLTAWGAQPSATAAESEDRP